jgi:hypothetical protein
VLDYIFLHIHKIIISALPLIDHFEVPFHWYPQVGLSQHYQFTCVYANRWGKGGHDCTVDSVEQVFLDNARANDITIASTSSYRSVAL